MNWNNWNDFVAMGGYAPYVWGSFIVMAGALCCEVFLLGQRRRTIHAELEQADADDRGQP